MKRISLLVSTAFLCACNAADEVVVVPESISLDGWTSERIALPPDFAPAMPAGEEQLLFAPGMFDASAEDYWSYAFVMRLDRSPLDAESIDALFEAYYDGLIARVGESRGEDLGDDPAQVHVRETSPGHFELRVDLIDAFVTMEPIRVHMLVHALPADFGGGRLLIQASPQAREHAVWHSLEAAVRSLEFRAK